MNKPITQIISKEQKKLFKTFVLMDLYIQEVDNILDKKKEDKLKEVSDNILNKAKELQELMLPLFEEIYKDSTVSKSLFFIDLQKKFDYSVNFSIKHFKTKK